MKRLLDLKHLKKQNDVTLDSPQNDYYESVSAGLGIGQVVLYLALFAFVILSFFRNTELITYQNFYYFFKDLNASAETVDVLASDSVSYPTSDEQSFALYRKGLAVAGNNGVTLFTATGRQTLSKSFQYQNPIAVGSGKYLLVYEMGGVQYSLYNSYTQIYSGKSEHAIYGAAVSDSGMYALISYSEEYTSVVSLYSSHFSLLNRYNKNGYVMDAALNEKGSRLALLTSSTENGLFKTELTLHTPRKGEDGITVPIGGTLGLSASFTASGDVDVLCGDGYYHVSTEGKVVSDFDFDERELICAELGEDGAAFCLRSSAISEKNHVIVFDKNGKMLYNDVVTDVAEEICRRGDGMFLLTSTGISRLDLRNKTFEQYTVHTDQRRLLAVDENEVLLCSPQKAEYIRFD